MNSPDPTLLPAAPDLSPGPLRAPVSALALILLALSLLTAVALAPLAEAAFRSQPAALAATLRSGVWIAAAATPLVALAKGAALGAVAWAVLVLGGRNAQYRSTFAIVVAAELILAVQGAWIALLLRARGVGAITSPEDLRLPTGLDVLFSDPTTALGAMAGWVTPFHAAWVIFLAWRFTLAGGSRPWGVLAAAACWIPAPLVAVGRALVS